MDDDWKTFKEKDLNILYIKEKEILPAYIWRYNSTHEKQIILLMIPNEERKKGVILHKMIILLHFSAWIALILSKQKISSRILKKYVNIKIFVEL